MKDKAQEAAKDLKNSMQDLVNKSESFESISMQVGDGDPIIIAQKNKEKETTRIVDGSERLECVLTDQEKLFYSKDLTEHIEGKKGSEDALKSFKSQMKSEIDGHIAAINLLSNKIGTGKEYRVVDIEIHFDYNTRTKTYIRTDSGQVYKTETIRQDELQLHLDLEEERLIKESKG